LPVNAGDKPLPLGGGELTHSGVGTEPGKTSLVEAALAEPDASAIPKKQFDTVVTPVAKEIGAAVTGRSLACVLDDLRESVNTQAHVDGFGDEPDVLRRGNHGSCLSRSASQAGLLSVSSIRQPPGLCSSMRCVGIARPTLTGTRVRARP